MNYTSGSAAAQSDKLKSYSRQLFRQKLIRHIVCILFCLLSVLPFLLLIINSTRSNEAIKTGVTLIPSTHFAENLKHLIDKQNGMQITLWRAMLNSLIIAAPGTFCAVYFSAMTAYGVHVYNFKLKNFAWGFILGIMFVPNQITIIGFYRFMLKLNLVDSYIPLIVPAIAAPSVVFFMKQYMESTLSIEMIEAARIDGAGEFRIFNTIIVPIMKPALATQAIFQFVAQWNNLFTPTIMITSEKKKTLPMFVQMLTSDQFRVDYGIVYMGLFITIIPLLVAYLIFAKYIVAGVALGGVKG
ncbi:MAG: carbohydrate ABC transporter permease [Lachnospiraceae bacterium]|jgi:multiple sugar transport system permease protein|nr:carbohydrate ABC transporter permease [Lachnospiraceae bacterium]MEE3460673.1 carbohydrate ABC transporter permease [Lachnospiraceae bacterium]